MLRSVSCLALLLFALQVFPQKKNNISNAVKFGDVTIGDFNPVSYSIDTTAEAIILYDIGLSEFDGGSDGDFTLNLRCHKRARIMKKGGFDIATVSIPIYIYGSNSERLDEIEAVTYNLEGGKIVATKLEKSAVFYDKLNKYYKVAKFTFPNIREGSIIEYRYKLNSPFYEQLRSWSFQDKYPVLWSEYSVIIPSIFQYLSFGQHYYRYNVEESQNEFRNYSVRVPGGTRSDEVYSIGVNVTRFHWVIRNLPALKNEDHIFSEKNYIEKMDFMLDAISFPNQPVKKVIESWPKLAEKLMKDEEFGATLNNNGWLKDDLAIVLAGASSETDKAKRIYAFVRNNFKCTDDDARELSQPLKKTFLTRSGNVADINLLLTSMYLSQKMDAKPVLLSTRDNGFPSEIYPSLRKFNYVICKLQIGSDMFLLDASQDLLGFNRLSPSCYNKSGRIIDETCLLVPLNPDSVKEQKRTAVFITNQPKGGMNATVESSLGYFESYDLRRKVLNSKPEDFFKTIKDGYSYPVEISKTEIDSLKKFDEPVTVRYELKFDAGDEDLIYFNPMLGEAYKRNPFTSDARLYPVEMPYVMSEVYTLNMEVPKGYKVEEIPKSTRVKLNENEGLFEYMIRDNTDGTISLKCRIELYKAGFEADDYEQLRAFFGHIVMKQAEPVVFKKIK